MTSPNPIRSPLIPIAVVGMLGVVLLLVQNMEPLVQLSFLGFTSSPLPLSLTILLAFISGSIVAGLWNQLAAWVAKRRESSETGENVLGSGEAEDSGEEDVIEVEYLDQ